MIKKYKVIFKDTESSCRVKISCVVTFHLMGQETTIERSRILTAAKEIVYFAVSANSSSLDACIYKIRDISQ